MIPSPSGRTGSSNAQGNGNRYDGKDESSGRKMGACDFKSVYGDIDSHRRDGQHLSLMVRDTVSSRVKSRRRYLACRTRGIITFISHLIWEIEREINRQYKAKRRGDYEKLSR